MKLAVYCELSTRDDEGNVENVFGLRIDMGEAESVPDYATLTAGLDKAALLEFCCLSKMVAPEDLRFITEEEYDAEYGSKDGSEDGEPAEDAETA